MSVKYSAIAADIKAHLESIPGTGIIHEYERQIAAMDKFIALFKDVGGKICGCEITRKAVPEQYAGVINRQHQMLINVYMGLQDAAGTGIVFQDLCDDIVDHFREAAPLTGSWEYRNTDEPVKPPAQILLINERMFGAVLCHCGIISLSVNDRII